MKKLIGEIACIILVLCLMSTLSGCGRKEAEKHGQEIADHAPTRIDAILKESGNFDGKTVTVEGEIIRECPTGCWFDIKDQAAVIHVDIKPSGFAIPQKTGKTVTVEGKVSVRDNQPIIVGTGVEIR